MRADRMCVALCLVSVAMWAGVSQGAAGDGVKWGVFRVHPYLDSQLTYDSNVFRAESGEDSDVALSLSPGLKLSQFSDTTLTDIELWGKVERYADLNERDHEDVGERLGMTLWDRDTLQVKLSEAFKSFEEFDTSTGDVEQRNTLGAGIGAGRDVTDKLDLDVGYNFDMTDYESPNLFDWSEHVGSAEVGYALTDKSAAILTSKVGVQTSDGSEDGTLASVLVGMKTRLTDKVKGRVGAGWYGYDVGSETLSLLGYDGRVAWQVAPKVVLNASANNGVEPATQDENNFRTISKVSLAGTWSPIQTVSGTLSGWYMKNDYQEPVTYGGMLVDKNDETTSVSLRVDYKAPSRFLVLYAETRVESKSASIQAYDYDQVVGLVGMTLTY